MRDSIRVLRLRIRSSDVHQLEAMDRLEDWFNSFVNSLSISDVQENLHSKPVRFNRVSISTELEFSRTLSSRSFL